MRFDPVHVGMDFNVGKMAACASELHENKLYTMKEFVGLMDTPEMIECVQDYFPKRKIIVYPDASGKARQSNNAKESDISLLRNARFTIRARSTNPLVRDRIAAVNLGFAKKLLFINTSECPELTEGLEQQIYDDYGKPDKTSGLDHIVDAYGYKVVYLMPVKSRSTIVSTIGQ